MRGEAAPSSLRSSITPRHAGSKLLDGKLKPLGGVAELAPWTSSPQLHRHDPAGVARVPAISTDGGGVRVRRGWVRNSGSGRGQAAGSWKTTVTAGYWR